MPFDPEDDAHREEDALALRDAGLVGLVAQNQMAPAVLFASLQIEGALALSPAMRTAMVGPSAITLVVPHDPEWRKEVAIALAAIADAVPAEGSDESDGDPVRAAALERLNRARQERGSATTGGRPMHHAYRDYSIQVVNAFLELLDGAHDREGVVVIGACNDATRLDPAMLRAGRLERVITLSLPEAAELEAIFRLYLAGDLAQEDLSTVARAAHRHGGVGADVEGWCRGARRRARVARRGLLLSDIEAEVGPPPPPVSPDQLRRIAVHEAGHAVALLSLGSEILISVEISETGRGLDSPGSSPVPSHLVRSSRRGRIFIEGFARYSQGGRPRSSCSANPPLGLAATMEIWRRQRTWPSSRSWGPGSGLNPVSSALWASFKAALPDPLAGALFPEIDVIRKVDIAIREHLPKPKLADLAADMEELLDRSVVGVEITRPLPDPTNMDGLINLGTIDFEKLKALFEKGRGQTAVQLARNEAESKAQELASKNPTRQSFLDRYQQLVADYNERRMTAEEIFAELMRLIASMAEEDRRAARENLGEEELALFDVLTQPDPQLPDAKRDEVKDIAKALLDKLRALFQGINWQANPTMRAKVRSTIKATLRGLPDEYDDLIWEAKVAATVDWVFRRYGGATAD